MSESKANPYRVKLDVVPRTVAATDRPGRRFQAHLTRLSTFASTANFFRGETPRDGVFGRESSRIAFANAV